MSNDLSFFLENGYKKIRNVWSRQQVSEMRAECDRLSPNSYPFETKFISYVFDKSPVLRNLILRNPKVLQELRAALGEDFVLIDEHGLHDCSYFSSWHCDTSSPEWRGLTFRRDPDFNLIQCAVYLQPNTTEFGGGLTLVPKSHLKGDPWGVETNFATRLLNKLSRSFMLDSDYKSHKPLLTRGSVPEMVMSSEGDFVFFDMRIWHKSTPFVRAPLNDEHRKLAIFFVCGRNNSVTYRYRDWINEYHDDKRRGERMPSNELTSFLSSNDLNLL
jgi:hypothetical protein